MSINYRIPLTKTDTDKYRENYDQIFGKKEPTHSWDANGSPIEESDMDYILKENEPPR